MLVLSRCLNECIVVDDIILIYVRAIQRETISLEIRASNTSKSETLRRFGYMYFAPNHKIEVAKIFPYEKVRLGFEVPNDVKVWRKEIWNQIQKESDKYVAPRRSR